MENKRKISALHLRRQGLSYRDISRQLGIARSTLSYWLKDVEITTEHQIMLRNNWLSGVNRGRLLGAQKNKMLKLVRNSQVSALVKRQLNSIQFTPIDMELLFVGLYMGDGFKSGGRVGFGNSNPDLVKLYLTLLRRLYPINESKLRVQIFARVDQRENVLIEYWSNLLSIPPGQFHKTQFDKRTSSIRSRENYYGVCAVVYGDTLLQRRILAFGEEMIKYVGTLSSGG